MLIERKVFYEPHFFSSTIFRWITVKNLNQMNFEDGVRTDTPMGLLRGIKYGTESYHVLFKRLCRWDCRLVPIACLPLIRVLGAVEY